MDLLTKVNIPLPERQIGYQDKILLLGSCFADNMGKKFKEYYFQTSSNPFGTLYNPVSIANSLSPVESSLLPITYHNGMWHSMMHHGAFSHSDRDKLLRSCEQSQNLMNRALQEASFILVTFGTAWVYEYKGKVVANCHKLPAKDFVRRRLTIEEIVQVWMPIVEQMSDKRWIFTVSPIRHIKDGLHENQISKSILLQAVDYLTSNSASASYFPSYEIMLDELRDYRFYAEDMLHPSQVAVDYIWQRFADSYFSSDTCKEMRVLHQLWRDRNHRFLHPESQEAQAFVERLNERVKSLKEIYPWLA
jgi:hypothetical protein